MPNHRKPTAQAALEGRHLQHPERHKNRTEPRSEPLGPPPNWLNETQAEAWDTLAADVP